MNRVPLSRIRQDPTLRGIVILLMAALSACSVPASDAEADEPPPERLYRMDYRVTPDPGARGAFVELAVSQPSWFLRELSMPLLDDRISEVSADGEIDLRDGRVAWTVPAAGGKLRWFALIDHRRDEHSYDAYIDRDWALFRGMDIIPSARTRSLARAESRTRLRFDLPDGWSSATPYFGRDDVYEIDNPQRRFDTPTGWFVLGRIGVRNDSIGNVRLKVAGPIGHSIRRLDMLALMRWNLPELLRLLPDFPERLTFVSAGDPMWRGALSAPNSFYVHSDRPLISENATSTLLHEAVHVGLRLGAEPGADWVVEGIAEYYSLEMLRRSGTISMERYRDAHRDLAEWGRQVQDLCTRRSSGSTTARAVTILVAVDGQIRKATGGDASLDGVLHRLAQHQEKITVGKFREIVAHVAGMPVAALKAANLPGCS